MRIFLMGFMGSGKTTMGKQIASCMDLSFTDLDAVIEEQEGLSISEIFQTKGEAYFRKVEQACLTQLLQSAQGVIALGGGTPCYFDNLEKINAAGTSIYLKLSLPVILQRLSNDLRKRPLLYSIPENERECHIEHLLNQREAFYSRANLIINGEKTLVEEIVKLLKED